MNDVSTVVANPYGLGITGIGVIFGLFLLVVGAAVIGQFIHADSRRRIKEISLLSLLSGFIVIAVFFGLFYLRLSNTDAVRSKSEMETMGAAIADRSKSPPSHFESEFSTTFSTTSELRLDENSGSNERRSQPLLPEDHPEWVAQVDRLDGDVHRIAVATELQNSIAECRAKLDDALLDGTRRYIDEHLTGNQKVASKLPNLNVAWIRASLLKSDVEYDAEIVRPSDTYHQLWVQLEIGRQERETIQKWIQQLETTRRAGVIAFVVGGLVVCFSVLNAGFRMFSKAIAN